MAALEPPRQTIERRIWLRSAATVAGRAPRAPTDRIPSGGTDRSGCWSAGVVLALLLVVGEAVAIVFAA